MTVTEDELRLRMLKYVQQLPGTATRAQVKTIYSFKIDRLRILDDFDVPAA
jgi:hypothetical protein